MFKFTNYSEDAPFGIFSILYGPAGALQPEIAETDIIELATLVAEHSSNRPCGRETPEDLAGDLRRAAAQSCRLRPQGQDAVDTALAMTCDNVRVQGQITNQTGSSNVNCSPLSCQRSIQPVTARF